MYNIMCVSVAECVGIVYIDNHKDTLVRRR